MKLVRFISIFNLFFAAFGMLFLIILTIFSKDFICGVVALSTITIINTMVGLYNVGRGE